MTAIAPGSSMVQVATASPASRAAATVAGDMSVPSMLR